MVPFSKQKVHSLHFKLKTLEGIHKKNVTLLETSLLTNCGETSSLSRKNWRISYPKRSTSKADICYQQIGISRPYWLNDQAELDS